VRNGDETNCPFNFGRGADYNERVAAFSCRRDRAERWYLGDGRQPTSNSLAHDLAVFGQHLYDSGIVDMTSLAYLWPRETGEADPGGQPMNRRTFRPVSDVFTYAFLGPGVEVHDLDIEGVERVYGGWNEHL
jgi:hypothetical protein